MSDSSSDTSVGSSPYQSDQEVMTYVMVGEDTNTDSGDTCARHSNDSNTVRLEEEDNKPSLDGAGCSTNTLQGTLVSLREENIQLKKELEFFDRMSLVSGDSGFHSETSSLASWGSSPRRHQDKVGHLGKTKDGLKMVLNLRPPKQKVTQNPLHDDTDLHLACKKGDLDRLTCILSESLVDPNSRGKWGVTPIMVAAEMGHRQVFDLLVTQGADVTLVDDNRNNILHVASLGGHVDMVKYVLSQKVADINSRGQYGRTPLMVAAEKGLRQVFDLLVGEEADVSLVDDNRDNILHVTCLGGHVDMVKYVLSQKVADIHSRGNYGRTPLMMAAEKGHRRVFDLLVTQGADVTLVDDDRHNILHVASLGGHVDIVKYVLLQKVADINSRGRYGWTPLMVAAQKGHRQVFDLLVTQGADVSLVDDDGNNVLHVACLEGHVDIVKYVLSQKVADINSRGRYGWTPLMVAAQKGHRQVFDLLVGEEADVSLVDDDGNNVLHVACLEGHVDMVKYVLSQKVADINSRGQYGRTPLMVAAEKGLRQVFDLLVGEEADVSLVDDNRDNILHVTCLGGHVDMVKYVLSQKVADIHSRGNYGRTPLMMAAEKGHRQVFDLLVTQGADVTLVDDDRHNILHVASLGGHVDIVKYVLLQKVADINSRGRYGWTPLMVAAQKGHRQVFDLLVTQGADVSLVDDDGNNVLHVACLEGHVDIVKYVLSQKVADINSRGRYGSTPLMVAAQKGHRQVFDLLVGEEADVSLVNDNRNDILHVACLGGHVDIVKNVLSQKVADINIRGRYGKTPLMVAAQKGHRQVFDLLVTQGADVSLVDDDGNNVLHVACLEGHVDIVKYVLSQKVADINSRGQYGSTPLMMAAEKGLRQVFDLLVTQGADVSLVDDDGNNVLHVACLEGHVDIVKYVLSQKVADINSRGQYGSTPLMMAAEKGLRQVFDLLVGEEADVSLVDDNRDNILHVTCLGGHVDMVKYVLSQKVADIHSRGNYGRTPLMMAAEKGHRQVFDLLVTQGADVTLVDDDRHNILHVASLGGHVDIVKYVLLQKVADINSRGRYGWTPLMVAAQKGHRQVFDLLVGEEADVSLVNDNRNDILHVACLGGDVDIVKYVLSQKVADINIRGRYGKTPLMVAAQKGHRQVFDLLVTQGADVSLVDDDGNNVLHVACLEGHVDIVKYVLSQKVADINSRGRYGWTPLMVAAQKGHRQVFDLLVGEEADVSLVNDNRNDILHVACLGGHVDIVKYVLSQKVADINIRGRYGKTPLMVAAQKGHRQVFDLLVTQGADVSLVDDDGNNVLHVACLEGHVDIVKYVLSQKVADINSRGQYGSTPLMMAAEKGLRQVFDLLVGEEADVSLVDDNRDNILHVTCLGGHVDMVKYVLSQKVADIHSRGNYGRTPLMMAAEKGHRQVFDLLVTQGADVTLVDDDGDTILHVASLGGHAEMVKYVLSQKFADINSRGQYGRTPMMMAAEKGHRQVFDFFMTQGADVTLMDDNRDNILHVACLGGHVDMVKYVLSQKVADINSRGQYGWTPPMVAAQKGHRQVFDLLVREGVDVSLVGVDGNNILHVASLGGHVDIVKYVLSQKVTDINSRGEYGRTSLMLTVGARHRQVFDLLVREGADVSLVDDNGNNILQLACLGGHVDMVKHVHALNVEDVDDRNKHDNTGFDLLLATQGSSHV
ncbi:serine/threonine-protein phosphatase 6 regulatory ankyrin repeat subunit B-like [Haliotis cracherodii]|uniref:serine/threonine-protein phosphatase 6 regulatory ankyrin repeat subunit B-like n=1 Tax=Haliotis cracherodii TaxID=6455 RepID=UPI0039EC5E2C